MRDGRLVHSKEIVALVEHRRCAVATARIRWREGVGINELIVGGQAELVQRVVQVGPHGDGVHAAVTGEKDQVLHCIIQRDVRRRRLHATAEEAHDSKKDREAK